MKKPTKLISRLRPRSKSSATVAEGEGALPNITNETIAVNREEVLSSARKYIYPLQHSKHKIVLISTALFIAAFVFFFSYCTLALYRFKSTSGFIFGVTQVVPFPVAKAGSNYVAYENYLFELRHYVHYYQTQLKQDFNSQEGRQQLAQYRKQALQKVINDAYVKQLADAHSISVSSQEINGEITLVRNQNRLGANEKGFEDVLKDNFGWTINDFKRSLKQEMLAQKVVSVLDTTTQDRARAALAELQGGADFAAVAAKYSDDVGSKGNGGNYGFPIDQTNLNIPPQVTTNLFDLKPGQVSGIINTGFTLEIVKNISAQGGQVTAAHIVFTFQDINTYIKDYQAKHKTHTYIHI